MVITKIQEVENRHYLKGLDNPANYPNIIIGSFNPFTHTAIYNYGDYRLWLKPFERIWVVWRNEEFCFSFERETPIVDMIERMDKL